MTHSSEKDYECPTCHWTIRTGIPHECNYRVCHRCNGTGRAGWRDKEACSSCGGDGKWHNDPPEEGQGALVPA